MGKGRERCGGKGSARCKEEWGGMRRQGGEREGEDRVEKEREGQREKREREREKQREIDRERDTHTQ